MAFTALIIYLFSKFYIEILSDQTIIGIHNIVEIDCLYSK